MTHPNETKTPIKVHPDDRDIEIDHLRTELNQARAEGAHLKEMLRQREADYNRLKRDVAKAVAGFDYGIGRCGSLWGRLKDIDITPAMAEGGQE